MNDYRPDTIYLQTKDEHGDDIDPIQGEISWCEDRINEADITYVRSDLHDQQKRDEAIEDVALELDEMWNCNCLTDESLGRTECECVGAPARRIRNMKGGKAG